MAIPTDDDRDLLTVIASMRAKPGKEQELRAALEALIEPTLAEAGNVTYALHQGADDPAVFYLYENWTGPDALAAHFATPHLSGLLPRTPELLDGDLLVQHLRRIG